jgi:hypothetical protein
MIDTFSLISHHFPATWEEKVSSPSSTRRRRPPQVCTTLCQPGHQVNYLLFPKGRVLILLHLTPVHIMTVAARIGGVWRSLSFEPDHFRVDEISTNFDRILLSVSNNANCLSPSVTWISTYLIALSQILLGDLYTTEIPPSIEQLRMRPSVWQRMFCSRGTSYRRFWKRMRAQGRGDGRTKRG